MSPKKIKTSAGMETVDQTVARAKAQVAPKTVSQQAVSSIASARANKNAGGIRESGTYVAPAPTPQSATISTSTLAPATPLTLAEPTPATQAQGMMAEFQDGTDTYTANLEAQAKAAEAPKQDALSAYINQLTSAKGLTGLTAEAYAGKGGVDAIAPELNDINDKIRREQLSMRRQTEAVTAAGGQSKAQAQAQINNIERESFAKQADLSIIQQAVQGRYNSAKEIADRAVAAQLEQQTNDLAILKFNYDENKELFTKAEQRAFESAQADRENKLAQERDTLTAIKDLAIKGVTENGMPSSIAQRMMAAKTLEEAIGIGGSYLTPAPETPDGFTLGKGETRYEYNPATGTFSAVAGGVQPTPSDIAGQGGGIFGVLEASAQYDKTLEASERQNITKALNVAGQLNTLSDLTNLDSETYGPIIGQIRGLNPFDTNAQEFKAIIQGIVPNLARGIYGEVGVLTDQDIENYAKTLPTLSSTEEVQDAMLGLTLKLVRDSVRNQLTIAAESGLNVSGLANTVERLDKMVGESLTPITMKSGEVQDLIDAGANREEIEGLLREGYDITEVENYYTGGGTSENVSFNDAITASADAIAAVESGGNYQAVGPVIPSGQYAGDQALGKYQIMSFNIPAWSKEALGREISSREFLANPELQDQIFAYKFGQHARQYGTLEDAASAWFSGQPLASAGGRQDVLGTSVPEYVRKFQQNLKLYA